MIRATTLYILVWLVAGIVAGLMAMQLVSAAYVDGQYVPLGNDSFYHARRILDAAIGERGFYEFDPMIHAPEGSWLNWPWAYDYLLAAALSLVLWMQPDTDPMAFLAHVPVFWGFVNIGLLVLIARQVGLSPALTAIAALAAALLPLTQMLHGVGMVDHHFIEQTFVLATVLTGLRFFDGYGAADAIAFGAVLGLAPAFHIGLFVLQIPVLACVALLWLRGAALPRTSLVRLAAVLVVTTVLVLLPSAAFRDMQFEFWTLSWFHLYIAAATAISLLFIGWRPVNRASVAGLAVVALLLAIPVFAKMMTGAAFLTGKLAVLESITEVKSPIARLGETGGLRWVTSYYSLLIFLAPVLLVVHVLEIGKAATPARLFLSLFAVFGLLLMLTQYRLHPFGSWALLIGGALLIEQARAQHGLSMPAAATISALVVGVALLPSLKNVLFYDHPPGLTRDYATTRTLFYRMAEVCAQQSGTALSYNDDGHYIRYHTDCSVVTNNFLMTPFHAHKLQAADRLLQMTPEEFLEENTDIRYLFVRMYEVFDGTGQRLRPRPVDDVIARNAPLFVYLTFSEELPDGFRLLGELRVPDDRNFAYARLIEVTGRGNGS